MLWQSWEVLVGTDLFSALGAQRCILGAICLGHLIRHGPANGAYRLSCARFASLLLTAPFQASVVHPQRAIDFANYVPVELVKCIDVFADPRCTPPQAVLSACRLAAVTLLQYGEEHAHSALPVLSLYEHVATYVTALTRYVGFRAVCVAAVSSAVCIAWMY